LTSSNLNISISKSNKLPVGLGPNPKTSSNFMNHLQTIGNGASTKKLPGHIPYQIARK